jgi:hypothetical protein
MMVRKQQFNVGDTVQVSIGRRSLKGTIVEDRGPLGVGGRRLYGVRVPLFPDEMQTTEVAADQLSAPREEVPLEPEEIVKYLKQGGLVLMLQSHLSDRTGDPRVWLCRDSKGNVTHTFLPELGMIGGEVPPQFALHDYYHVYEPKRDDVTEFLRSFGLSQAQVEEVVEDVGTTA